MVRSSTLLASGLLLVAGCSEPTGPMTPMEAMAGKYLGRCILERNGATYSLLNGGVLRLTLHADGRTEGLLWINGGAGAWGGDAPHFDRDLGGTWTLTGDTLTLQIREPVFLSRMLFTVDGDLFFGKLREDETTLGVVFRRCGFGGC
jgi:hypothetical protein